MLALSLSFSQAAAQQPVLVIGTVGGQLDLDDAGSYRPFSDYLARQVPGQVFEVRPFASIETLIAAVDAGELDFAMLTPAAYVTLSRRHQVRTIATVTQSLDSGLYPWLAGAVFVQDSRTELRDLEDLEGRDIVALSPLALGGWLSVLRELRELGIDESADFSSLEFIFSYERVIERVCDGSADAGFISAATYYNLRERCDRPLRVLDNPRLESDPRYPARVSTRLYPEVAFVETGQTGDEALIVSLTQALLSVEADSEVARSATVAGFTAPLSYDPVVTLMQELRLGPFENYGEFTVTDFVRQHSGKVLALVLFLMAVLTIGFARSQLLNRRLGQAEQFRRVLFEKSNLPVAIVDAETLEFIDLNPAAVRVYGFREREELIGQTPLAVSAPVQKDGVDSMAHFRQRLAEMEADRSQVFEWLYRRPDGSAWEAELHMLPFTFDGVEMLHITLLDVTERNRIREERERIESQLHHSQRLESLGRLSGAIAHDFNNLLTVINGYSELLLMKMDKDDNSYRTVMEIAQAGWRARELTNQLLTFGRRHIASVKPIDVNAMILNSGNMFRSLMGENIELQTVLKPDLGMTLADSSQLNQVLVNMLVNAKDAMPSGGLCLISTDLQRLDEAAASALGLKGGDYIVISVSDNGSGMSEEIRDHVFEPFFSTKEDRGSGIGLATAYGIIRQSDGTISFHSEQGVGTTFTIYLPLTDRQPGPGVPEREQQGRLKADKAYTVLVAEDQPDVRAYACSVLRSAGYRVLEADSGSSALARVSEHDGQIDLLFTDVVMPEMNGRELAERIAERWPGIKVLFTSGYTDDEVALHGVVQDRIEFISKPYVPLHLLNKLREVLSGSD